MSRQLARAQLMHLRGLLFTRTKPPRARQASRIASMPLADIAARGHAVDRQRADDHEGEHGASARAPRVRPPRGV